MDEDSRGKRLESCLAEVWSREGSFQSPACSPCLDHHTALRGRDWCTCENSVLLTYLEHSLGTGSILGKPGCRDPMGAHPPGCLGPSEDSRELRKPTRVGLCMTHFWLDNAFFFLGMGYSRVVI